MKVLSVKNQHAVAMFFPAFYDLTSLISRDANCNVRRRAMDKGRPASVGFDEIIIISQHKNSVVVVFFFSFFFLLSKYIL